MEDWDREKVWEAIHELSDIRAGYNFFNAKQRPKYHACSLAIKALREVIGEPVVEVNYEVGRRNSQADY